MLFLLCLLKYQLLLLLLLLFLNYLTDKLSKKMTIHYLSIDVVVLLLTLYKITILYFN